MKTLQLMSML